MNKSIFQKDILILQKLNKKLIMRLVIVILLFVFPIYLFPQDIFDLGIRNIEIFFSQSNWDDSLDIYYANNNGERLVADSIVILWFLLECWSCCE